MRAYGDAINASDRYTPAYVNRGLAYMQLGQYEKAIDDFSEAIRLEPTRAEHYFKRGVAYEQVGNNEKAADSFASAIELDDKNAARLPPHGQDAASAGRRRAGSRVSSRRPTSWRRKRTSAAERNNGVSSVGCAITIFVVAATPPQFASSLRLSCLRRRPLYWRSLVVCSLVVRCPANTND